MAQGIPNPEPVTGEARRLEQVRSFFRIPTLKAFLDCVSEVAAQVDMEPPSYASVRLYHIDRKPPVSYIDLVCRTFGIEHRWLITGQGEMLVPSATVSHAACTTPDSAAAAWWSSSTKGGGVSGMTQRGTIHLTEREKVACKMVAGLRGETESAILRQFTVAQLIVEMERLKELLALDDAEVYRIFSPGGVDA